MRPARLQWGATVRDAPRRFSRRLATVRGALPKARLTTTSATSSAASAAQGERSTGVVSHSPHTTLIVTGPTKSRKAKIGPAVFRPAGSTAGFRMARGERTTVARGRGRGGGRGRGRESAASTPTEVRGPVGPLLLCCPATPARCPATPTPLLSGRRRRHQRAASTRMRAGSSSRAATRRGSSGSTTQRSRTPSSTRARPRCGVTPPCCSPPLTTLAPSCPLLCTRSASALPARRCV